MPSPGHIYASYTRGRRHQQGQGSGQVLGGGQHVSEWALVKEQGPLDGLTVEDAPDD